MSATGALTVAVLGAGNWGSTLADLVARNGHDVRLWTRSDAQRDEVNARHTNTQFVPGLSISPSVTATTDLTECLRAVDLVLIAIPAQSFRDVCRAARDALVPEHMVIHGTKGLEKDTYARMSEILVAETCVRQFGVLCGPNIATEVAARKPAGTVVVSHFPRIVQLGRRAISCSQMMVFAGEDVVGVELAAALKNVVAIAAGMANAMDVGENAKAFLVTRGLAEISRLAISLGASPTTFMGLAGIGDLMVTCASPHSRNHRVGAALARGQTLQQALADIGMVAEGVFTAVVARDLARRQGVDAPLVERVYRVLYEGLSPQRGLDELMRLPAGHDVMRR